MPEYVYGCEDKTHPRSVVIHKMFDNPVIPCSLCGTPMHRIPQPLLGIGYNATEVLVDWMEDNYKRKRAGRALNSPEKVQRPGKPIPGTNYKRGTK
jgi:hypothetical protein